MARARASFDTLGMSVRGPATCEQLAISQSMGLQSSFYDQIGEKQVLNANIYRKERVITAESF